MNARTAERRSPSYLSRALLLLIGFGLLFLLTLNTYRPDRAVPLIEPGTSSGPTFFVQIIRPREGLPLGGLIPPEKFGADAKLGFDSESENAGYRIEANAFEFIGDDYYLRVAFDENGQPTRETEIVFNLRFEDQIRRVRCRPGNSDIGWLETIELEELDELSGQFTIGLPVCDDVETGASLGWPPRPLLLRGSFDRLQVESNSE